MAPPGLAARIMNPTFNSAEMGSKRAIKNAMSGNASICTVSAVKKARGCRMTRIKSENVSDKPTPNITSAKTDPTERSTKKAGLNGKANFFCTKVMGQTCSPNLKRFFVIIQNRIRGARCRLFCHSVLYCRVK